MCIRGGRSVRIGRAGSDHVQRVSYDIGQDDGKYLCRRAQLREPSAFDRADALAQRVHFHNIRPAAQQLSGQAGQLVRRTQRLFKQRRAAARDQQQHAVLRAERLDERDRLCGGVKRILIGHRVPGLADAHMRDIPFCVSVFGDHNAVRNRVPQAVRGRRGHLPCGFSEGDQNQPARGRGKALQRALYGRVRQHGTDRGVNNTPGILANTLR